MINIFRRKHPKPDDGERIEPVESSDAACETDQQPVPNEPEQDRSPQVKPDGNKKESRFAFLKIKNKQSDASKTVSEPEIGNHSSVLEADPFAFKTAARRNAFFLRFFVTYSAAATLAVIVLVSSITSLFPLKTTEFVLLRVDPNDDRIYQVEPVSVDVPGYELMVEKIARRFVREILTIDEVTQNSRFDRVRRYSDSAFFNTYIKENKDLISRALSDGLNRSITIQGANKIVRYDDIYQFVVEFTQTDRIGREKPTVRKLRAYLELAPRPQEVKEVDKFENPLGIRVLNMAVKEQPSK